MLKKTIKFSILGFLCKMPSTSFKTNLNPLSPNSDLNQICRCNIKGLLVKEVMRTENMIT